MPPTLTLEAVHSRGHRPTHGGPDPRPLDLGTGPPLGTIEDSLP